MIDYFNRLTDRNVREEFDIVVDRANALTVRIQQLTEQLNALHIPTMREIQINLQQGGSNPLNLTGLQGRGGT